MSPRSAPANRRRIHINLAKRANPLRQKSLRSIADRGEDIIFMPADSRAPTLIHDNLGGIAPSRVYLPRRQSHISHICDITKRKLLFHGDLGTYHCHCGARSAFAANSLWQYGGSANSADSAELSAAKRAKPGRTGCFNACIAECA